MITSMTVIAIIAALILWILCVAKWPNPEKPVGLQWSVLCLIIAGLIQYIPLGK